MTYSKPYEVVVIQKLFSIAWSAHSLRDTSFPYVSKGYCPPSHACLALWWAAL